MPTVRAFSTGCRPDRRSGGSLPAPTRSRSRHRARVVRRRSRSPGCHATGAFYGEGGAAVALTIPLPVDVNGRRFVGWGASGAAWLPSGTRIGSTDFAVPHALLVDASGNALVVGVDLDSGGGTANRVGIALLVPASEIGRASCRERVETSV